MTQEITTKTEKIVFRGNGILHCTVLQGAELTLDDGKEIIRAIRESTTTRWPTLVDIRNIKSISRECREYFAGEETAQVQSACALLVGSMLTKVIANFFIGFNKALFPTRMFNAEDKAVAWLLQVYRNGES